MSGIARAGRLLGLAVLAWATCGPAHAGHSLIDKIYHPYVQPLEKAFEFRTSLENGSASPYGDHSVYRVGYGQALGERWMGELYLLGTKNELESFDVSGFELEALWQLTEQGEYFLDWGLLFELDKPFGEDKTELAAALLVEKEWRRWSGTANIYANYHFDDEGYSDWGGALSLQARYRYAPHFEPALEYYRDSDLSGIGPVVIGTHRLGNARALYWEAGVIFGTDNGTADTTFKALLELEF